MLTESLWGLLGIAGTAIFGIWAINDARIKVKKSTPARPSLGESSARLCLGVCREPTEKALSREIAKGLQEFTGLYSKEAGQVIFRKRGYLPHKTRLFWGK
jgi:hypothetical protein